MRIWKIRKYLLSTAFFRTFDFDLLLSNSPQCSGKLPCSVDSSPPRTRRPLHPPWWQMGSPATGRHVSDVSLCYIVVCEADLYTLKLYVSSFYMFKEA